MNLDVPVETLYHSVLTSIKCPIRYFLFWSMALKPGAYCAFLLTKPPLFIVHSFFFLYRIHRSFIMRGQLEGGMCDTTSYFHWQDWRGTHHWLLNEFNEDSSIFPLFSKRFSNMFLFWNYLGLYPCFETQLSQNRVSMMIVQKRIDPLWLNN